MEEGSLLRPLQDVHAVGSGEDAAYGLGSDAEGAVVGGDAVGGVDALGARTRAGVGRVEDGVAVASEIDTPVPTVHVAVVLP